MKMVGAVAASVIASEYLGNKIANSITGPELGEGDAAINNVKILGAKTLAALAGLLVFTAVFGKA
jgi:hypothetical protein